MPFAKLPLPGFHPKADDLLLVLPFVMVLGFVIGTMGHVYGSRRAVVVGIVIVFVTTLLLPLVAYSGAK